MVRRNKNFYYLICLLLLLVVLFNVSQYYTYDNQDILTDINPQASKPLAVIHIDNNWTAAKAIGICAGDGTIDSPYIIENLDINGSGFIYCLLIQNSNDYFLVNNCKFTDSEIGIKLAGLEQFVF